MATTLYEQLEKRILLLDGGFGTMVPGYGLTEADYRGERFRDWPAQLQGVQRPAGADAPRRGARNPRKIPASGSRHHRDRLVQRQRRVAGRLRHWRGCAYEIANGRGRNGPPRGGRIHGPQPAETPLRGGLDGPHEPHGLDVGRRGEPRGPRSDLRTAGRSLLATRRGDCMDGGADILLVETVFDTLNAKAALYAIDTLLREAGGRRIRVMVSGTLADASGRTLSGQTVEAFCRLGVARASCSPSASTAPTGPGSSLPYLERLAAVAETRVSAHPNAGLPNVMGGYDETPGDVRRRCRASTCGADWSTSWADAAAPRPRTSSNSRKSPATTPRDPFRRRAASRR